MDALDDALDILTHYTGMFLPEKFPVCKAAHTELVQLRQELTDSKQDIIDTQKYVKSLMNERIRLLAELETMFQATVSVLGDDEHRGGRTTERTLELCRNVVASYITNHPTRVGAK